MVTIILGHIYSIFGFRYYEFLSSPIAFESFFILSGFYMAMVWQNDYSRMPGGFKKFLYKRVFRIFPLYWLVLVTSVVISLITYFTSNNPLLLGPLFSHWAQLNWSVRFYVFFSNIFIFGQEAIFFLKINFDTGAFEWGRKFIDGDPPLHFFLLISQAWAISYILYFYLLLPLLNRFSSMAIFILMALLVAARFIWYHIGHEVEPWLYRFYPFEFAFFLGGMLSARAYDKWKARLEQKKPICFLSFIAFFALTCLYDLWYGEYLMKQWIYYALLCVLMPLFFALTKDNRADNYLGQLAYPAYICNFIIIHLIKMSGIENPGILMALVLGITLLVSILLVKYIVVPLNKFTLSKIVGLKRSV